MCLVTHSQKTSNLETSLLTFSTQYETVFVIKLFSIEYHHFSLNLCKLFKTALEAFELNQFLANSLSKSFLSSSSYLSFSFGICFAKAIASLHSFQVSSLIFALSVIFFICSQASLYQLQTVQFIEQFVKVFLL